MGDITPKPKPAPPPDDRPEAGSNPAAAPDTALGESPGSSIVMPEIPGWNAETPEPVPPPKGYFPPVDLIEAWRQAAAVPAPAAPAPSPAPPHEPSAAQPGTHDGSAEPVSHRLLILLTVLGLFVVAGLGGGYYLFFRPAPNPQPVVVPTETPDATPTPRPTLRPSAAPVVPPPTSNPPAPKTYTVLPGDTLITIGEKLGVDWHQIAAANGQIQDPNFITPGQVLKIP